MEKLSPLYVLDLINRIEAALYNRFPEEEDADNYILRWHVTAPWGRTNFDIAHDFLDRVDIKKTLINVDDETLLKIAMDLGVETPGFLPMTPIFKNELEKEYPTASESFERAFKMVAEDPNMAVSLANTTLESILKKIIKDDQVSIEYDESKTTFALIKDLCKDFKSYAGTDVPKEIYTIVSSLTAVGDAVENLRSRKTLAHGKIETDYILDDPMYAYFVVNSVTTVGMFLIDFYQKKYPEKE